MLRKSDSMTVLSKIQGRAFLRRVNPEVHTTAFGQFLQIDTLATTVTDDGQRPDVHAVQPQGTKIVQPLRDLVALHSHTQSVRTGLRAVLIMRRA